MAVAGRARRVVWQGRAVAVVDLRKRGALVMNGSKVRVVVGRRRRQGAVGQRSRSTVKGSRRGREVLLGLGRILGGVQVLHGRVLVIWRVLVVVRRRGVHGARRSPARVGHGRVRVGVLRSGVGGADGSRLVRSVGKGRAGHGAAGDGGDGALLVHRRLGVHALLGPDVTQLGVVGWLLQTLRGAGRAGKVADQVQVLARRCRDAERLLDQAIGLVAVAVGAVVRGVVVLCRGCLGGAEGAAAALALHLAVRQEAARHAAGAPRLAVRPSSHARLALVPHKDRA